MATVKNTDVAGYLNEIFSELEGIKGRIQMLREDLLRTHGRESALFQAHDRHLLEMEEYVEWKLNVLEKGTPFDWKIAGPGIESTVSVKAPEAVTGPDFSGGYVGG